MFNKQSIMLTFPKCNVSYTKWYVFLTSVDVYYRKDHTNRWCLFNLILWNGDGKM